MVKLVPVDDDDGIESFSLSAMADNMSPALKAANAELSAITQNPAYGQYEQLAGWKKPIVAASDIGNMVFNGATFGFGDKAVAAARAPFTGRSYDEELADARGKTAGARARAGVPATIAELTGSVSPLLKLAKAGVTGTRFASAVQPGLKRLGAVSLGSAADGAVIGGTSALGHDTDVGQGVALGATIGGLTPAAFSLIRTTFAPLFARMAPDRATNAALETMVERSGKSPRQIVAELEQAAKEGQDVYMVADALGNPGQRMLSTIARTPNEGRRAVVEALENRQAGQGDRIANSLSKALNAPDTAAQRASALTSERSRLADMNYSAARQGAGPVDVSGALAAADDVLLPGVNRIASPSSGIADDSLEGVVRRAQRLLTDGKSNLSDFSSVLRAKQDIADMIGSAKMSGRGNQVKLLSQMNGRLDEALERASPGYRTANDTFRQQSATIDALETGGAATSGRSRAADNIAQFQRLRPAERMAFRAGYADPLIARVESSAPGVNKARPLMNDKTAAELRAFAIPRRANRIGRQLSREQTMFETRNAALGGSKTADNMADQSEMGLFDPTVLGRLLTGDILGAGAAAGRQSLANLQGLSPTVRARLATALVQRSPDAAGIRLAQAIAQGKKLTEREMATVRLLIAGSVNGTALSQR